MKAYRVIVPRVGIFGVVAFSKRQVAEFVAEYFGVRQSIGILRVPYPQHASHF